MSFTSVIREIVASASKPLTPQQIREIVKYQYPEFYGTEAHVRNVEKGHYKDIDHALLAQIYIVVKASKNFYYDDSYKPVRISLRSIDTDRIPRTANLPPTTLVKSIVYEKTFGYENKIQDILEHVEHYHQAFYDAETFVGPSLYFHKRAIETRAEIRSLRHLEYIYATLTAWGMHRMGKGGSKMVSFGTFCNSLTPLVELIVDAQKFNAFEMSSERWAKIKAIFCGIKIMATGTSIVGNSKVMHHMMPNIVPPIDREYTLRFLRGNTNIINDLETEWQLMYDIISKFFIPVASENSFQQKVNQWLTMKNKYPWDTSTLKIIDNLIIGQKKG